MQYGTLSTVLLLALCACRSDRSSNRNQDNYEDTAHSAYGSQRDSDDEAMSATSTTSATHTTKTTAEAGYRSEAKSEAKPLSAHDREFTEKAAQGGLLEVETSRLALRKNVTGADREFADMMIADHGKANRELEDLVRSKGGTPPNALDREHQHEVDALRQLEGVAFA